MKSLRFRILVIFTIVFVGASFATWTISDYIAHQMSGDVFEGQLRLELDQARIAFETGGIPALRQCLSEMDSALPGTHYLLDARGRDLVSGVDHSRALSAESAPTGRPYFVDGQALIVKASLDHKYHLLIIAPPPPPPVAPWRFMPFFALLTLAIALLGWFLSIGIVVPLHRVAAIVERFGKGDLRARVRAQRKDEIGDLGRSFDSMADHIETLLTAERRLLQDVSHELRSPLARLSFAAELMKGAANPAEALDRMRREIVRLSQLIDNLIEVTRVEGDPSSRETRRFSLTALMREVMRDCVFEAEARKVAIAGQIDDALEIDGNPELVRRAVENVLRNAIRFSPEESSISVEVARDPTGITVTISDSGPGVPEELLTQIFDPFVRVDQSRNSESGGVGLGLSIARRAVLLHHGAISAKNLCPGLQLTITLPTGTKDVK
jgi:two-component system sensor histidine kinase CpxA